MRKVRSHLLGRWKNARIADFFSRFGTAASTSGLKEPIVFQHRIFDTIVGQEDALNCVTFTFGWDETKQKVQNSNLFLEPMEGPKDEEMEQMYLSWKICHEILPASKLPTPEKNRVARGPKFQT